MKQNNKMEDRLKVESINPLSPHNEALYELGKEMLKSSITTARDFCKFMITICTGLIPIYLGLLKLVSPKNTTLPLTKLILFIIPPLFFLISVIVFILGYFPQTNYFSLDIIEEIKVTYEETVRKRRNFIIGGTVLFGGGTILAIIVILILIIR